MITSSEQNNEQRRKEIEAELEKQKQRLIAAATSSTQSLLDGIAFTHWIRKYPMHTAGLLFLGGLTAAQLFYEAPEKTS